MHAELGLLSSRSQRDVCSLMFLWRVLHMPRGRLTRQVFDAMGTDRYLGSGDRANWARSTVPSLLKRYMLQSPASVGRSNWKKQVIAAVTSFEAKQLRDEAAAAPTSKSAEYLSFRTSAGLPRYLHQRRSWWMSYGRSVKTKLRCGTSELEVERGRYDSTPRALRHCRCCPTGEVECSFHYLMRCPLHSQARARLFAEISALVCKPGSRDHFGWLTMTPAQRWSFLLGDGPPVSPDPRANMQWGFIETQLYHYLACTYKARRAHLE